MPENEAPSRSRGKKQEVVLAMGWVAISEGGQVGNAQSTDSFWKRVLKYFANELGGTKRSHHQLNSKWRQMNRKVLAFNGIYNNLVNSRRSGQSDDDVKKNAYKFYRTTQQANFVHEHVWDVVKNIR